jgi:hypothetical protein
MKESIEKLARKKAEESAKQEALTIHFIAYLPFVLIACIMAATRVPTILHNCDTDRASCRISIILRREGIRL